MASVPFRLREKRPFTSVVVPLPLCMSYTVAPIRVSPVERSTTLPLTVIVCPEGVLCWAMAAMGVSSRANKNRYLYILRVIGLRAY